MVVGERQEESAGDIEAMKLVEGKLQEGRRKAAAATMLELAGESWRAAEAISMDHELGKRDLVEED